jgi:hypothetical protein
VDDDPPLDRIAAQAPAGAGREDRVAGQASAFGHPDPQGGPEWRGQRNRPVFTTSTFAAQVCAGSQRDVAAVETEHFGDPQSGLDRDEQESVVTPALPGGAAWCGQQGGDVAVVEERHAGLVEALEWYCQHPAVCSGCRKVAYVNSERIPVSRALRVRVLLCRSGFDVVQEIADRVGAEVVPAEARRWPATASLYEVEQ